MRGGRGEPAFGIAGGGMESASATAQVKAAVAAATSGKRATGVKKFMFDRVTPREAAVAPLLGGGPLRIGTYEIAFHIGAYFAAQGTATSRPPFLDVVPIRFAIAEPEAHYHVPLLASPWAYSTYRGS